MSFQERNDCANWFRKLSFPLKFDYLYYCFVVGASRQKKITPTSAGFTDVIQHFPEDYSPTSNLIVALLLAAELKNKGVNFADRALVHQAVRRLIDPNSSTKLSAEGIKEFNAYAAGGFDEIASWFPEAPQEPARFFSVYVEKMSSSRLSLD